VFGFHDDEALDEDENDSDAVNGRAHENMVAQLMKLIAFMLAGFNLFR